MTTRLVELVCGFDQVVPQSARSKNISPTMQSEVEPYLDKNIWNTLASNIPVDSMGYSKDMLPDSRDIINFVEGSQSILIDTREGIHGELVGSKDEALHLRNPGPTPPPCPPPSLASPPPAPPSSTTEGETTPSWKSGERTIATLQAATRSTPRAPTLRPTREFTQGKSRTLASGRSVTTNLPGLTS